MLGPIFFLHLSGLSILLNMFELSISINKCEHNFIIYQQHHCTSLMFSFRVLELLNYVLILYHSIFAS